MAFWIFNPHPTTPFQSLWSTLKLLHHYHGYHRHSSTGSGAYVTPNHSEQTILFYSRVVCQATSY